MLCLDNPLFERVNVTRKYGQHYAKGIVMDYFMDGVPSSSSSRAISPGAVGSQLEWASSLNGPSESVVISGSEFCRDSQFALDGGRHWSGWKRFKV